MHNNPEFDGIQNLANEASKLSTFEHVSKLLSLLQKHYDALVKSYYDNNTNPPPPTIIQLLHNVPPKLQPEFDIVDIAQLKSYVNFYARNNPPKYIKDFATALKNFMDKADKNALKKLNKATQRALAVQEKLKQEAEQKKLAAEPKNTQNSKKSIQKKIHTPIQEATSSPENTVVTSPAVSLTIPSTSERSAGNEGFEHSDAKKENSAKETSTQPLSSQLTQEFSSNSPQIQPDTSLQRLNSLIELIQKEYDRLDKGSNQFFTIRMGNKAKALNAALVYAMANIGNSGSLSDLELQKKFLTIKSPDGKSLYDALNIHRLSFTNKSGNSFFTDSHASSLQRVIDNLPGGRDLDTAIVSARAPKK